MVVKKIAFVLISFLFVGCLGYRTNFHKKRFKNIIYPNEKCDHSNIIDTTKLYKKIYVKSIIDDRELDEFNQENLKFYKNCKVGDFYNYDNGNINSLNPKKADMGFYYFKNDKFFTKVYFDHPQGGGFLTEEFFVESKDDTLILKNEKFISKYKIIQLPKEFLIYKPDW